MRPSRVLRYAGHFPNRQQPLCRSGGQLPLFPSRPRPSSRELPSPQPVRCRRGWGTIRQRHSPTGHPPARLPAPPFLPTLDPTRCVPEALLAPSPVRHELREHAQDVRTGFSWTLGQTLVPRNESSLMDCVDPAGETSRPVWDVRFGAGSRALPTAERHRAAVASRVFSDHGIGWRACR